MNPRVTKVVPLKDYILEITFENGETRLFDVNPYLEFGVFKELRNESLFNTVTAFMGSVKWQNDQDFCPDTLYEESVKKN